MFVYFSQTFNLSLIFDSFYDILDLFRYPRISCGKDTRAYFPIGNGLGFIARGCLLSLAVGRPLSQRRARQGSGVEIFSLLYAKKYYPAR